MAKRVSKYTTGTRGSVYSRNLLAMVDVEFEGEWVKASTVFSELPKRTQKSVSKSMMNFAKLYLKELRKHIRQNGKELGWKPLGERYSRWRELRGFSGNQIYRLTGNLYRALTIYPNLNNNSIQVTVKKDSYSGIGRNPLTSAQVVKILESGSIAMNIQARPLFAPTYRLMGGNRELGRIVTANLSRDINKSKLS